MLSAGIEISDKNDNIIKTKDVEIIPNPNGLADEIFANLQIFKDNIAQTDVNTGQNQTYQEFFQRCATLATSLKKIGVKPGDILATHAPNHFDTTVAIIGSILIGAKPVAISPLHTPEDTKAMMEAIKPKYVFVSEEYEVKMDDIVRDLNFDFSMANVITYGANQRHLVFDALVNPVVNVEEVNFTPFQVGDLEETAIIVFSSGKSDTPKAKCFSHRTVLSQTQRLMSSREKKSNSLIYSGLDWIDTHVNLLATILSGNTWFIAPDFDPSKLEENLNKYDIHHLTLSVLDSIRFLRHWKPNKLNAPKLKTITVFAKKLSAEIINDIQKTLCYPIKINNSYNLSEIYGPCFATNSLKPDSVGVPIEGFWYKVIDPNTNKLCGPYKKGEICIKSKFCMNYCYDETARYFDDDGYLKTGDLGYFDDEHNFFLIDPLNEILTFNTQISPTALAQILYQHPAVKIAGIFGIPSENGDIVTGVVVKSETYPDVSEAELIKFVNDRVEDFEKISGGIMFVDEELVPFTPTGKVRRYILQKTIFEDFDDLDMTIDFT